jgi:hypothetical protein
MACDDVPGLVLGAVVHFSIGVYGLRFSRKAQGYTEVWGKHKDYNSKVMSVEADSPGVWYSIA